MINDVNHLILIGTLGEDAKAIRTKNDGHMTILRIATNDQWSDGNELKKKTHWNSVVFFGDRAISCENYRKGMKVHITAEVGERALGEGDEREFKATIVGLTSCVLDLGKRNRPSPDPENVDVSTPF